MKINKRLLMAILLECIISFMISMAAALAQEEEIALTGTIEIADSDILIRTEETGYILLGQDLSHYAGRKMTLTGAVITEKEGNQVFRIDLYELVEDE